jgi:hypothetical protein
MSAERAPLNMAEPFTVRLFKVAVVPSKVKLELPPNAPLELYWTVDGTPPGVPELPDERHVPLTAKHPDVMFSPPAKSGSGGISYG